MIPAFQKKTGVQIVNLCVLTDGDATDSIWYRRRADGSTTSVYASDNATNQYGRDLAEVSMVGKRAVEKFTDTSSIVRFLRTETGCNALNFRIAQTRNRSRAISYGMNSVAKDTKEYQIANKKGGENYIKEANGYAVGEGAGWAFAVVEEAKGYGESYANLIPTPAGGTHESGLRDGIFEAVKAFVEHHNMMPRGIKLMSDDLWSKTIYFLSAKVLEPQFHGQTKEKLSSATHSSSSRPWCAIRSSCGSIRTSNSAARSPNLSSARQWSVRARCTRSSARSPRASSCCPRSSPTAK
jgi:hypothetical protein